MAAIAFIVQAENGSPVSIHARRAAAESIAFRIGCDVVERQVEVGEVVRIMWQGWAKKAVVVEAEKSQISVEFSLASGRVVKSVSVEKIVL
jgi:hypothetical protein